MRFTYSEYQRMIELLDRKGYIITNYEEFSKYERCVILRHDIDYDMKKAVKFAEFEKSLNVHATYMVLVTSDFYNVFSKEVSNNIAQIRAMGHDIGLHFDEQKYLGEKENISKRIIEEINLLRQATGCKNIKTVSMHRPSKECIKTNIVYENNEIINTYNNLFFKEFKYVSDSRMHWREPVLDYINSMQYNRLHILTHSFWYEDREEKIDEKLKRFIDCAKGERIWNLKNNFTNLDEYIKEREQ